MQETIKDNLAKPKDMLPQLIKSYHFAILLNLMFICPMHIFIVYYKCMVIYCFTN